MRCFKKLFTAGLFLSPALFAGSGARSQSLTIHTFRFRNVTDAKNYFHYTGNDVPVISGHRGGAMKGYPENCIATFEHTLSATPAMFEIDPHLTRDSGIVLLHDNVLDRTTTGHGKLNDHTLEQVEKLRLKDPEGNITPYHLPTLEEAIEWSAGKTIINLDVKDVPPVMKAALVKKYNAFGHVMFTVHNAAEAKLFYDYDRRSLFSAWILTKDAFDAYEKAGIPWSNFLIGYVGPKVTPESRELSELLHEKGVMAMIGAGPSYDKLSTARQRADAYRNIIKEGFDIIESDRPVEVAAAIKQLYPEKNPKFKFMKKKKLKK